MNKEALKEVLDRVAELEQPPKIKTRTVTATLKTDRIELLDGYAKATDQSRSSAIAELIELGFKYLIEEEEKGIL